MLQDLVEPYIELGTSILDHCVLSQWWVDDQGCFNVATKLAEGDALVSDVGVTDRWFLYRWSGFVKVDERTETLRVQWDVRRAHTRALDSVMERLRRGRTRGRQVELVFFFYGWNCERHETGFAAAERMEVIQRYRDVALAQEIMMRRKGLDVIPFSSRLICMGYETWDRTGGSFFKSHLCAWFGERALIFSPRDRYGHLVFKHVGLRSGCVRVYGYEWACAASGSSYAGHSPDYRYTTKVCPPYKEVLETGEPRLDHIRALIHREDNEPVWVPYQRLILKSRQRDGTPVIVCLSDLTQRIDIPFMAA